MAIVRLVNGVADAAQRGRTAVSVAGLAAQAGPHPVSLLHCCFVAQRYRLVAMHTRKQSTELTSLDPTTAVDFRCGHCRAAAGAGGLAP